MSTYLLFASQESLLHIALARYFRHHCTVFGGHAHVYEEVSDLVRNCTVERVENLNIQ